MSPEHRVLKSLPCTHIEPTPGEGYTAELVDVGPGSFANYEGKDVRGKIVLAEFGYGGKLLPSFPKWLIDGTEPSRLAWLLKEKALPWIYWNAMLKGREWLAGPEMRPEPTVQQAPEQGVPQPQSSAGQSS